jgi:hypothetical protein
MANNTGKKYGGREAGTPNKLTAEVKEIVSAIALKEIKKLPKILEGLEPYQRAQLTIKLLQYILPKPEPMQLNEQEDMELTIRIFDSDGNLKATNNTTKDNNIIFVK